MDDMYFPSDRMVSADDFSFDNATRVFDMIKKGPILVLRNSRPTAVVISCSDYEFLRRRIGELERRLEQTEDERDVLIAEQRLACGNETIPWDRVLRDLDITEEDLGPAAVRTMV